MLFFNSYGDIEEVELDGSIIVDNGHAVAWEPGLQYDITHSRRIRSFLFADQILMRYHGQGRLWIQSRSPRSLANWVYPFRPQNRAAPANRNANPSRTGQLHL